MIAELRNSAAHVFVDSLEAPVITDFDAHHLLKVLRVKPQDVVTLSDGNGKWRTCRIGATGRRSDTTEISNLGEVALESAPTWSLTIAFCAVKGDRPEWTVQKLTEIGVDKIFLLAPTSRSVVRWGDDRADKNIEKLRVVAREAAMQSRRVWLPEVTGSVQLASVGDLFIADPSGEKMSSQNRVVAIGPEGGFSDDELKVGQGLVSLGETLMRAETAAISAAVQMSNWRIK